MKVEETLRGVSRLFLDTAPVIYYVEANPRYLGVVQRIFDRLDEGTLSAVTSSVTLAECLVFPCRANNTKLQQNFTELITLGRNTTFVALDEAIAAQAASLRARYNLTLTDAFQMSAALHAGCDAFLTNDLTLRRITELHVLALDEMQM